MFIRISPRIPPKNYTKISLGFPQEIIQCFLWEFSFTFLQEFLKENSMNFYCIYLRNIFKKLFMVSARKFSMDSSFYMTFFSSFFHHLFSLFIIFWNKQDSFISQKKRIFRRRSRRNVSNNPYINSAKDFSRKLFRYNYRNSYVFHYVHFQ